MSNPQTKTKVAEWAELVGASLPDPRRDDVEFDGADCAR